MKPATEAVELAHVQDTALWVAAYRAQESRRRDALFEDPHASLLAGERGEELARALDPRDRNSWAFVIRTLLFDQVILECLRQGADTVVNLAAGLDARPYRMPLPSPVRWIEVDHPSILDYKEQLLGDERPACAVERIGMDLTDVDRRRRLFSSIAEATQRTVVVTEGLLVYLQAEAVMSLALDLAAHESFRHWALDLASPGLLDRVRRQMGRQMEVANATPVFAPTEGPGFFASHGWRVRRVHSVLRNAVRHRRVPWWMRPLALLPESKTRQGKALWSGVCLLDRTRPDEGRGAQGS